MLVKGIKVRLKPTKEQEEKMWQSAGTHRWAYNYALSRRKEYYEETGKTLKEGEIRKEITQLKKQEEYKWLGDVAANIPKQAVKDMDTAYKNFFKRGNKGFPKYKKKNKGVISFYNSNETVKVDGKKVKLERLGWVKTSEKLPEVEKYMNPRISYDGKYWYISVGIEVAQEKCELTEEILGVDLGVSELAIVSNGKRYKNINKSKEIKRLKKKLKRKQKAISRKYEKNKEGLRYIKTENIKKEEQEISLLYRRIRNIRENQRHQITTELVKTKPKKIVIEDLNIKGMMKNRHLSKAIGEMGWYDFRKQLEYKCKYRGIELVIADRFYPSSKMCSKCGNINKKLKLSDRVYNCNCGLSIDRDMNASINLSNYKLA